MTAAIVFGCTQSAVAESSADTQAPTSPTQLASVGVTTTSVTLRWTASTDNVGVTSYEAYIGDRVVGTSTGTTYTFTGLACSTYYKFSIDALDAAGNRSTRSYFGASTSACGTAPAAPNKDTQPPTAPTDLTATGATASSISVSWTASTDNVGVTGYGKYRNGTPVASGPGTTYTFTGLACGTNYTLAVDAADVAGNRSTKTQITASTSSCAGDVQAPTAPTNLATSSVTGTSIGVSWTASTDNVGVTGYGRYLNGTLVGTGTGTSYTFTGLPCGTAYTLAVDAVDAAGNRSTKAQISARTSACSTPSSFLLGTQTLGAMSDYNPAGLAQAFSSSATASGTVGGLHVYVDTQSTATTLIAGLYANASGHPGALLGQGSTTKVTPGSWNDVRLPNISVTAGSVYWIALLAPSGVLYYRDACCSGSVSYASASGGLTSLAGTWSGTTVYDAGPVAAYTFAPLAPDTSAPTAPTQLAMSGATQTSVSLTWAAATDDTGVTGYGTYVNGVLAGTSAATTYTVTGLTCGTTYTLAVDATDAAGNRSGKAQITASTSACSTPTAPTDTQAPTTPAGLAPTAATASSISVSWTASTDNVGVTGYGKYQNGTLLTTSTGTTYTFTGLACGTTYTLAVDATDAAGNRSGKAQITASTSACSAPAPPPPTDTQAPTTPAGLAPTGATASSISVSWTASTDNVGVTGYGKYQNGTLLTTSTGTTYTFTGLACGTTYTLAVDATDAAGNRSGKAQITSATLACADTQAPTTPTALAPTAATASSISVSWTASTDNVGVTGYGKYQNGTLLTTSTGTTYTFTGLACGTTYTLAVDATDAAGNRSARAQISASTSACAAAPFVLGTQTLGPMSDYNPAGWAQAFATTATASGTVGGLHVWVDQQSTAPSLVVGLYADASGQPGTLLGQGSTPTVTPGSWNDVRLPNVNVAGGSTYWIALLAPSGTLYYRDACCGGSVSYVSSATSLTSMPSSWSGSSVYDAGPVAAYSFAPLAPDTSAPTAPTSLTTSGATQTSISLSWLAATDNVGVTGYTTYVNGTAAGSSTATSFTVTGLTCGTSYTLAVDATDAAGNRSGKTQVTASTSACSASAPPPPSGSPSVYVATTGSDTNACTSTAPCQTFDRAYHAASAGQIVQVAAGSYPDQTLGADSTKKGPGVVTFQPAANAAVTVADLYVEGASYVTFTNMTVGFRFHVENDDPTVLGSTNVTFNSMKAQTFDVVGRVANVTIHGGSFGNTVNHQPQITKFNQPDPNTAEPQNVVIEDSVFQNFRASDPSVHTECLQVLNANGLTIQRNKFSTCDSTGDLGLTCEPGTTNVTVENNWLMGGGSPGYGAQISGDCNNLKFRYNSATVDVFFADSVNSPPYSFVGNYLSFNSWLCRSSGVTYSHNVTDGGTCGSTDVSVPTLDFVGPFDLHLKPGANAINKGDPSSYPSTDIDGNPRPLGSAPDAGAVEAG